MYAAKRPLRRPAIIILILASYLLVACGATGLNTNWPGMSTDGEKVFVAHGPGVIAYDVESQSQSWSFPAEQSGALNFFAAPSIQEERIIIGDYGASGGFFSPRRVVTVYALEDTEQGTPGTLWTVPDLVSGSIVAPPLQVGDKVFLGTADNYVLAVDATTGTLLWEFETGQSIWGQPAYKDETLFVTSMDKSVYALDTESGDLVWEQPLSGALASAPIVNGDLLFIASFDGMLHALNPQTGSENWSSQAQDWIWAAPAYDNGVVYFADIQGNIFAVDAETGTQIWTQQINSAIQTRLAVVDDRLYVAAEGDLEAEEGLLVALSKEDGLIVWQKTTPAPLYTSPLVVDNTIVVALQSEVALLIGFDLETGGQKWTFAPSS